MDEEIEIEESTNEFVLTRAIFHILDYSSDQLSFSESTLNLEDVFLEKYVLRYVKKIQKDLRNRKGYFLEESALKALLDQYKKNAIGFVDFTVQACQSLRTYLEDVMTRSFDVLFVDYRYDEIPYLAIVLLESQQAIVHTTDVENGKLCNTLMVQNALMPSTSKKVNSFCLINLITDEIAYTDDTNWDKGTHVMSDLFLQCTSEKSNQEVIQAVSEIVNEVAVEYAENPSIALAKVKHAMKESAKQEMPFAIDEIAEDLFGNHPQQEAMRQTFQQKVKEKELPKEVEIEPVSISRKLKNQKIKTDTGIELTFPIEYFQNPDLIEFINHPDGTISIEIKNIGKIMNRS